MMTDCENKADDEQCEFWAGNGQCGQNPNYMYENCTKSCTQCGQCQPDHFTDGKRYSNMYSIISPRKEQSPKSDNQPGGPFY